MARTLWPVPPRSWMAKQIAEGDEATREERLGRWEFLLGEFGPPVDMLLVGGVPSMLALTEMKRAFVDGSDLATVLLAQTFIEFSLGAGYLIAGDNATGESGFARLIDESLKRGNVSPAMAEALHELRRMRNPYSHPVAAMKARSYVSRLRSSGAWSPHELVEKDAKRAVQIVVDYLRSGSPDWRPREDHVAWWEIGEV